MTDEDDPITTRAELVAELDAIIERAERGMPGDDEALNAMVGDETEEEDDE